MDEEQLLADLSDAIWYELGCRCERCGEELLLLEWERLRERDPPAWSRLAANHARGAGWLPLPHKIGVRCPGCGLAE
jgi:DNA-directed RNA polymerase subunit RPC12/RpoP